jgi:hypothetical protein
LDFLNHCISIRESLITGCIPLISNFGVFKERELDFQNLKTTKWRIMLSGILADVLSIVIGYHYKGIIKSFYGIVPSFMIPIFYYKNNYTELNTK